ncbi:hypothetical protein TNCV_4834691 [Trichonephila clavipes]|nr:hypothetical protein TNCV_4834691 [Trichonephila clavipes]
MPDATKYPPSTHEFPCRNCGGGGRWCRHLSYCHLYGSQGQRQAYLLPHATMDFVGLDLITSDRVLRNSTAKFRGLTVSSMRTTDPHRTWGCKPRFVGVMSPHPFRHSHHLVHRPSNGYYNRDFHKRGLGSHVLFC